jgi:tristetraprolin
MNLNPLSNALPGMGLYPTALGGMKTDAFVGAYPAGNATARQNSADQTRNLVNSLASLTAGYPAAPAAYAAQPMMDPQALMAYTAAFGGSPLLDLYGFTPELLAARTNALAQLANGAGFGAGLNYGGLSQNGGDDGPSPTNKKTNLYKTELCRSWEEKGTCRYGSKCQFGESNNFYRSALPDPC